MRLFIAIDPDEATRARVAALQEKFAGTRADVRWVDSGNYHVTIKFLGEIDEARVAEIAQRVDRAAAQVPVFPLRLEGVTQLPPRGPARVIVIPVISPDQRITKLHRLIDSGIGGMGLPMDTHVLVPHLTLGRVRTYHGLNRLLRKMVRHEFDLLGAWEAAQVILYHSMPGPEGSTYRPLHAARMVGPSPHLA